MSQKNTIIFSDFARRAKEKIEEKKKRRTKKLRIEESGIEITIRGISEQELTECTEFSDDSLIADKYMIYMACDDLHEPASQLVSDGTIKHHYEICDMFTLADRREIAQQIMRLSGMYAESTVKPVDEVEETKN